MQIQNFLTPQLSIESALKSAAQYACCNVGVSMFPVTSRQKFLVGRKLSYAAIMNEGYILIWRLGGSLERDTYEFTAIK